MSRTHTDRAVAGSGTSRRRRPVAGAWLALAGAALGSAPAHGGDAPELVRDIDETTSPHGSDPGSFVMVGDVLHGVAATRANGREVFRIAASGASPAADVAPRGDGNPTLLLPGTDALWFVGETEPITRRLTLCRLDAATGALARFGDFALVADAERVGPLVFLSASENGAPNYELWVSDGTPAGSGRVRDINVGEFASSTPRELTAAGSVLFFAAFEPAAGEELWSSDGTEAGTQRVIDLRAGGAGSSPRSLVWDGALLWFTADDGVNGRELFVSDGTAAGTRRVADVAPGNAGSDPAEIVVADGRVFFTADDGVAGRELWTSDDTPEGTLRVADVRAGSDGSAPHALCAFGSGVFFVADDGASGAEPWIADAQGASQLRDVLPGADGSDPSDPVVVGAWIAFAADDGAHGREPWASDGTPQGTALLADVRSGSESSEPASLADAAGALVFAADDGVHGREPWTSDGTESGTALLVNVEPDVASGAPTELVRLGSRILFAATDAAHGRELWTTDGSGDGTSLVVDADDTASGGGPLHLTRFGARVLFTQFDTAAGRELWTSDGTAAGTERVTDLRPGTSSSDPTELTLHAGEVWFAADDGTVGRELFASDGTAAGTRLVVDSRAGGASSSPRSLVSANGSLYFVATFAFFDQRLRRSDGTQATTRTLPNPIGRSVIMGPLGVAGDRVVVCAQTQLQTSGAWIAAPDDTVRNVDGPQRVLFAGDPYDDMFASAGGRTWFDAGTTSSPSELWTLDTPDANPRRARDADGAAVLDPRRMTRVGAFVAFAAGDSTHGREPWLVDADGPRLLRDVSGDAFDALPQDFVELPGGRFAFTAYEPATGLELWASDGTPDGTRRVFDLLPGPGSSTPSDLLVHGLRLYFAADDGVHGRELFRVSLAALGVPLTSVDSDGDAFPDEVEEAAGSSPFDADARPYDLPTAAGTALAVRRARVKLRFAKTGKDDVALAGTADIPDAFEPAGARVVVDVGGIVRTFVLDRRGRGRSETGDRFRVRVKRRGGVVQADTAATWTVTIARGAHSATLADEGLTETDTPPGATRDLDAFLALAGRTYGGATPLRWRVAARKRVGTGAVGR